MLRVNSSQTRRKGTKSGSLLVYGAGLNQVPLLEAGRREGWRIIAIDRNADAPGATLADRFLCLSLRDHQAIASETRDENLVGVLARITDHVGLESSCRLARDRGLAAPCPDLFAAATSKIALADHCRQAGLRTPRRYPVGLPISFDEGPVILRPDITIRGKAGIRRIESPEALREFLAMTRSLSANGEVDVSAWIEGVDVSVLVHLDRGHAQRLVAWDEWVALDPEGLIHGVGCGMPSLFENDTAAIDDVLGRLAEAFPKSRGLIALSLRIDPSGHPWVIEIHLGIGGDGIAEKLLPRALANFDAFELLARAQTGEDVGSLMGPCRPSALLRDGKAWRLVEADDVEALRARCLASLPEDWEPPRGLLGEKT